MTGSYVVKIVTDYELLIRNNDLELSSGDILEVIDSWTQDVLDPITGENLGSLDRPKATVVVERVGEVMTLCANYKRTPNSGLSAVSRVMSGDPAILVRGSAPKWPEGVVEGDPVVHTGRRVSTQRS